MQRRHDASNIPIELLRALVAIVDLGSYTKAAQALRLTQPAISAQIKRLQQLVGGEVFSKSGSGLVLTDRGSRVTRYARRILAMNDQILSLGGAQAHPRLVRLGLPMLYAHAFLREVLAIVAAQRGEEDIQICCDSSEELRRRLAAGYLDVAFIINPSERPAQVLTEWTEKWVWVCAPDLILSPGAPIPIICTPTDRYTIPVMEKAGRQFTVPVITPDLTSRRIAVMAGAGFMIVPERLIWDGVKVAGEHFLPQFPKTPAGIYLREGVEACRLSRAVGAFEAIVKPAAAEGGARRLRTGTQS